jgi:hypothetical protein
MICPENEFSTITIDNHSLNGFLMQGPRISVVYYIPSYGLQIALPEIGRGMAGANPLMLKELDTDKA